MTEVPQLINYGVQDLEVVGQQHLSQKGDINPRQLLFATSRSQPKAEAVFIKMKAKDLAPDCWVGQAGSGADGAEDRCAPLPAAAVTVLGPRRPPLPPRPPPGPRTCTPDWQYCQSPGSPGAREPAVLQEPGDPPRFLALSSRRMVRGAGGGRVRRGPQG